MEGKKISFGFMKTKKAEKPVVVEKKDYIDCLEENSIKVVGGEEIKQIAPLIIPLKPNTLITADRLKQIAEEVESCIQEPEKAAESPKPVEKDDKLPEIPENESIDQMAIRELLEESKKVVKVQTGPGLAITVPSLPSLDGQKESTLYDYESVPVQDFGLAMLRGMGWTPGAEKNKYKEPQLRPKGLGLGADKVVKQNQSKQTSKEEEELMIVKNAFVRINTGKYSSCYGKVVSLDEDNGRVMVDIAVRKEVVSLSEFMMQPVTKAEFDKQSRVINVDKYEEYKKRETEPSSSKNRESSNQSERQNTNKPRESRTERRYEEDRNSDKNSNGKSKKDRYRDSPSSEKEYRKKYSSNDSLSSSSDRDRKRKHKHNKKREKSTDSSVDSMSDKERRRKHKYEKKREKSSDSSDGHKRKKSSKKESEGKRDIDKKRKGKKKKRDRDRTPNYKKHRK